LLWWLAYIALGLFTGFFAGMLGIGGGLVMVPTLTMMFAAQAGFPPGEVLHLALGTSMAAILFTSLASLLRITGMAPCSGRSSSRSRRGFSWARCSARCSPSSVPARPLAVFFTAFVCLVAVQMILNLKPKASRELPGSGGVVAVGTGIGAVSALVAIGGGSLTVPFLTWCNVRVQKAIGTSAAVGFPIAVGGSLGYVFNGWGHPGLPQPASATSICRRSVLAGADEHADRAARGKAGAPSAGGHLETPLRRRPDRARRQDAVGSLRLMQAISGR
jgi:uncharacterized membrane protein YfcA